MLVHWFKWSFRSSQENACTQTRTHTHTHTRWWYFFIPYPWHRLMTNWGNNRDYWNRFFALVGLGLLIYTNEPVIGWLTPGDNSRYTAFPFGKYSAPKCAYPHPVTLLQWVDVRYAHTHTHTHSYRNLCTNIAVSPSPAVVVVLFDQYFRDISNSHLNLQYVSLWCFFHVESSLHRAIHWLQDCFLGGI